MLERQISKGDVYICIKQLVLPHMYTEPDTWTIECGKKWEVLSINKSRNIVLMQFVPESPPQIRTKLSLDIFEEYFKWMENN